MKDLEEQIKKKAIEYASEPFASGIGTASTIDVYKRDDFVAGANFILEKWREADRWRKVEEELPE